jgi:hypothetical protein
MPPNFTPYPPPVPTRVIRFPYTEEELEKMAQCPDPRFRRPARMSLWLRTQPEPPRDFSKESRAIVAHYDALSHQAVADCEASILEKEALKTTMPPSAHAEIDVLITDLKYERNYMWWRLFRVNDLPLEIFTNILRYVVWSTNDSAEGLMYRLHLTWVCKQWRRMAIADQTLWSVVWMRDRAPYLRSQVWLDRAGSTPLDIRINERANEPRFDRKTMEWLLNVLFPKLSQIRMLIVIVDTWEPALILLRKLQKAGEMRIPINIERFELHRAGRPYVWGGPGYEAKLVKNPIVFCAGKAPRLKYIALNGVYVDWVRSLLVNLTTLDLRRLALEVSPTLEHFRDILKACPNLHKLALDGAGPKVEVAKASKLAPVEMPTVRNFVMGDFSLSYALYVLSLISVPNTRDLTMMNMTGEDYSPLITAITGMFKDVRLLTLYTVDVNNGEGTREILVKWLRSMPLVGYLRIAHVKRHIFDAFLDNPTTTLRLNAPIPSDNSSSDDSTSREVLCPKLRVLEFQSVDSSTIIAFGEGRKRLHIPLRKIYVNKPWVLRLLKPDVEKLKSLGELLIVTGANPTPEESSVVQDD